MDHTYIEERGLIDLYHRGQIPPEEEVEFEEHFVACADCQKKLALARGFQRGLKVVVAEDAARAIAQAGLTVWLRRRWRAAALLMLVAVLPVLGYVAGVAGSREARVAVASWKERWEGERQSASKLERLLAESERRRQEERRELEEKLAQVRPPETPAPSPLVNTPLILLTAVRGEEETPVIHTGRSAYVSLAVDAGDDPRFASYQVAITGPRAFRQAGLKPNALEALLLTFPASYFPTGSYQLQLEGVLPDGKAVELGRHPFRVAP
jgi:Putative zinc-finger